jgi:uncharacterized protein YraI
MRSFLRLTFFSLILIFVSALLLNVPVPLKVAAQQATGSVPTVTSLPSGPYVIVTYDSDINVRSGPHIDYPQLGVLLSGQSAPARGRSIGGLWILIDYPGVPGNMGWIFASYVQLYPFGVTLPIVEAPSTPTPATTPTIDPTVVAALITSVPATRLPTFTPPGPLLIPTYESSGSQIGGNVPMGLVIILLGLVGGFGALISFLRGR